MTGKDRPAAISGMARWLLITLALSCGLLRPSAQQVLDGKNSAAQWETLENCQLATNTPLDGDSFHLIHDGREYIFRLYFVDTPEKDPALRERIQDQAAYFGISTGDVPRAGDLAARLTREKLAGKKITVKTRWQNAMGRSSLARFYCVLTVADENLAELLVASGLARIYGIRANLPDGPRSTTFVNKLKNLELAAREKKLGVWDESKFPRVAVVEAGTPASPRPEAGTNAPFARINLNTATTEELISLPTIGPKLAGRIIAARPFATVDDLIKVPGIGPKTLEKLRPLVDVTPPQTNQPPAN
jgi:competence protein ComEA